MRKAKGRKKGLFNPFPLASYRISPSNRLTFSEQVCDMVYYHLLDLIQYFDL